METVLDTASTETAQKKPVKVFRDRGLSVTVFRNTAIVKNREVVFFNSYVQRSYKDGDTFKTANSLREDDLLRAQQLLGQTWAWIVEEEAAAKKKAA